MPFVHDSYEWMPYGQSFNRRKPDSTESWERIPLDDVPPEVFDYYAELHDRKLRMQGPSNRPSGNLNSGAL